MWGLLSQNLLLTHNPFLTVVYSLDMPLRVLAAIGGAAVILSSVSVSLAKADQRFRVHLFGRFRVEYGEEPIEGLGVFKVQELLSYLLIHRNRPRPREALASLLWADMPTEKARKHLRQALWHVQTALKSRNAAAVDQILVVEDHWVELNTRNEIWVDVAVLEETFAKA